LSCLSNSSTLLQTFNGTPTTLCTHFSISSVWRILTMFWSIAQHYQNTNNMFDKFWKHWNSTIFT
jgi:hypothetical protein